MSTQVRKALHHRPLGPGVFSAMTTALAAGLGCAVALAASPSRTSIGTGSAGVEVRVAPESVAVGASLTIHASTRQAGFLVLLDVNAEGSVTQLYPNVFSMKLANGVMPAGGDPCETPAANTLSSFGFQAGDNANANRLDAGEGLDLPGDREGAAYALQSCPPRGNGMVFAVLSDKPVQIIDLPDLPASIVGQQAGADRLVAALQTLRLVSSDDAVGRPDTGPHWSTAWAAYVIR